MVLKIDVPHAGGGVALTLEKDGVVTVYCEVGCCESGGETAIAELTDRE